MQFNLSLTVVGGLILPWSAWIAQGWPLLLAAIAILLLRRVPVIMALKPALPQLKQRWDVLFLGWFGPIGVAALFYAFVILRRLELTAAWHISSLMIFVSVIVHGFTATPYAHLYQAQTKPDGSRRQKH